MRSRHQPLSGSHPRLQSEEVSDPRSLASSVKTLLEQHPVFKEPGLQTDIDFSISHICYK